jgi:hypothetical protein
MQLRRIPLALELRNIISVVPVGFLLSMSRDLIRMGIR